MQWPDEDEEESEEDVEHTLFLHYVSRAPVWDESLLGLCAVRSVTVATSCAVSAIHSSMMYWVWTLHS